MAKYTRAAFARLIDKKPAYITTLINRDKKLVLDADDYIDTDNLQNKQWLDLYIAKSGLVWGSDGSLQKPGAKKSAKKNVTPIRKPGRQKQATPPPPDVDDDLQDDDELRNYDLSGMNLSEAELKRLPLNELKELETVWKILKTREDTSLAKMKKETLEGKLIDFEEVKFLCIRNNKHMVAAFENGLNAMLSDITQRYKITGADAARYKGEVIDTINKACADAAEAYKRELTNIVDKTSEQRGRGEKK